MPRQPAKPRNSRRLGIPWDDYIEERYSRNPKEALASLNLCFAEGIDVLSATLYHHLRAEALRVRRRNPSRAAKLRRMARPLKANPDLPLDAVLKILDAVNLRLQVASAPRKRRRRTIA